MILFRPKRIDLITLMAAGVLLLLLVLPAFGDSGSFLRALDLSARDAAMRLRGMQTPVTPIAIVAIDDASFNYTGYHWPWPRTYLAQIVSKLQQAGAKVIGLDVFLFDADPDSSGDPALASALAKSLSVTVMQIARGESGETLNLPLPEYQKAVKDIGISGILYDEDAIVRSIQAYDISAFNQKIYFNWAFTAAQTYLGVQPAQRNSDGSVSFNGHQFNLWGEKLLLDFSGPALTYSPYYSAYQVVLGDYPADAFKDKLVLIGATSLTLQDVYATPFSPNVRMPGVEVIANAVNQLVQGKSLEAAPFWVDVLLVMFAMLVGLAAARMTRVRSMITLTVISMLGWALIWLGAYLAGHIWLALAPVELMLLAGGAVPVTDQLIRQELEKRRLRSLFARFVAPQVVDQLVETRDLTSLNRRATLTVLFADIRNFTSLAEKLPPDQLVAVLNPYLAEMTALIHQNGGTLDKYEGDGILAFFGAPLEQPDHALRAVRTACQMSERLQQLRSNLQVPSDGVDRFEIGIGLNTGDMFVGLLGSEQRLNYTVIGDAVNLASRLQDLTKEIGGPLLVTRATWELVKGHVRGEDAGRHALKGKREPVSVYRIQGIID